jgi:hypothetical protein
MTTTYDPRTDSSPDTEDIRAQGVRADDEPGVEDGVILETGHGHGDFRFCNCGCMGKVANSKRLFIQGHDQRLIGILTRAAVNGAEVHLRTGGTMTSGDALGIASHLLNVRGQEKLRRAVEAAMGKRDRAQVAKAEAPKPQPVAGTVKVGRWDYPAIREVDGNVVRNLLRDGTGEFVPADAKVASTFRPA